MDYKYAVGDTVQFKKRFQSTASYGLKEMAGKTVKVIDRRRYEVPCYKFEGFEDRGWFTEGTIKKKVYPYIIFGGIEPLEAASSEAAAIAKAKAIQDHYSRVEVIYMPEDDEDTNVIIYSYSREDT